MTEPTPATASARSQSAHDLARAIEVDPNALTGALLEALDRVEALVSVKEVASGRYVHAGARMAALFDREPSAMIGATDAELMEHAQSLALRAAEQSALSGASPAAATRHQIERNGGKREFSAIRIGLPRVDAQAPRHVLGVWIEQTAAQQREQQLQRAIAQLEQQQQLAAASLPRDAVAAASRDEGGGAYGGLRFDEQVRREVDLSSREHREFALVAIALDPLDDAARASGEPARERIVETLARLLRVKTRAMDASSRVDSDRFAVLLSGVGLATAHSRMEGLRRQCATEIVVLDGRQLGFTVSMGVASFPHTAHNETELLAAADTALAEARRRGGNHVALASIRFESGAS